MSGEPLDELYFRWLYAQVANPRSRLKTRCYWDLLRVQFSTEYIWLIANDDNRVEDGRALREEFLNGEEPDPLWYHLPCSFLEMAIALSRRLEFEADRWNAREWYWHLMENLELNECTDATDTPPEIIIHKINKVIWRTYDRTGRGGLFPVVTYRRDQRTVEVWYQMQNYLLENGFV